MHAVAYGRVGERIGLQGGSGFAVPRVMGIGAQSATEVGTQAQRQPHLPEMTSDETLMLEFQRGSREAFGELFERYRQRIYGFFRRRLGHAARAEELAQEAFVAVIRGAKKWEQRAAFRTWLYGIAMNLLMAERRKAGREEADPPDTPAPAGDADAALAVRQAIAQLDAEQREVLLLREYEQLSYEEIAGLVAVPVNTVRSRLFRARMALKEMLKS